MKPLNPQVKNLLHTALNIKLYQWIRSQLSESNAYSCSGLIEKQHKFFKLYQTMFHVTTEFLSTTLGRKVPLRYLLNKSGRKQKHPWRCENGEFRFERDLNCSDICNTPTNTVSFPKLSFVLFSGYHRQSTLRAVSHRGFIIAGDGSQLLPHILLLLCHPHSPLQGDATEIRDQTKFN